MVAERSPIPFVKVLAYLEEHGWDLTGIWGEMRVFTKGARLPILVEVHDKAVAYEDFQKIKSAVERESQR